ncbi:hypothetical protein QBC39DRAFT_236010, partial [Podospora conica]
MSGSGGFYKYRCKYFLTHNCPHWVYVNGAPCAYCCAEGREADENETETTSHPAQVPRMTTREICVPRVFEGTLQYTLMEFVESGEGNYWAVRHKMPPPPPQHHHHHQHHQPMMMSTSMVTSDTPRPVM